MPQYGWEKDENNKFSKADNEIRKAIDRGREKQPEEKDSKLKYWILAHDHVAFAYSLLRQFEWDPDPAEKAQNQENSDSGPANAAHSEPVKLAPIPDENKETQTTWEKSIAKWTKSDHKKENSFITMLLNENNMFGDLRVLDLYSTAIMAEENVKNRYGNWVQKFSNSDDALLFVEAQFPKIQ